MDELNAIKLLKSLKQESIAAYLQKAKSPHKNNLLNQLDLLDPETLRIQQALIQSSPEPVSFTPYKKYSRSGNSENIELGKILLKNKKVGCIILAGGQGTRLEYEGPKGTYVIPGVGKTLFQLFAERTHGPLAIMTSPENDEDTKKYWKIHNYFNLSNISFFSQSQLPLLDGSGNLFLATPGQISFGPDGNGSVFRQFAASGILAEWSSQGIEVVQVIQVDNALAQPFDVEMVGCLKRNDAEVVVKGTRRLNAQEKVGVFVESNKRLKVLEYTELGLNKEGDFIANLSYMCFAINQFKEMAKVELPLHKNLKKVPFWDMESECQMIPSEPLFWKFEKFIFDVLPYNTRIEVLECPRSQCFAPLKNAKGPDSPETVSKALLSCPKS